MEYFDFKNAWIQVDSLQGEQKPKSALEIVKRIKQAAQAMQNDPQWIKAVIYENRFLSKTEEDAMARTIERLEKAISDTNGVTRSVLHSVLADQYHQFLQQRQYMLRNRTTISGASDDDILTWDVSRIMEAIRNHYLASLKEEALKTIPVGRYEEILTPGRHTDHLRPFLFDILAHRAIDYFMSGHAFMTEPVYAFQVDAPAVFQPGSAFIQLEWDGRDTISKKRDALYIFQELLARHMDDEQPDAFVDADLKRLRFVYDVYSGQGKDSLYIDALNRLYEQHAESPAASEISFYQAKYWKEKGNTYRAGVNGNHRWALKKAIELCDRAIRKFPDAYGTTQCRNLKAEILGKQLDLKVEKVNLPENPCLVFLQYRNIGPLYFRLLKIQSETPDDILSGKPERIIQDLNTKPVVKSWSLALPDEGDHQLHSIETALPPLPFGRYILWVSDTDDFDVQSTQAYTAFQVSGLAYWYTARRGQKTELVVVDRASGKPRQGVKATFFARAYDPKKRTSVLNQIATASADIEGKLPVPEVRDGNVLVKLQDGEDVLFLNDAIPTGNRISQQPPGAMTRFFLDRAIYRPGQTVYFKAYLMRFDLERVPHIMANEPVEIKLYDVNRQEQGHVQLVSNAYGTVEGSFVLPASGLAGRMSLWASTGNSRQYFQVEEYKRPRFEVVMDPLSENEKLGSEVVVQGRGKAYAGAVIDRARVQYSVTREAIYPWWPWWRGERWFPDGSSKEIAHGTMMTDSAGGFEIRFTAQPDVSIPRQHNPNFIFRISVDITDASGETRSGTQSVTLGYAGFRVQVPVEPVMSLSQFRGLRVRTENLNGQTVVVTAAARLSRLDAPDRHFRSRYWAEPDFGYVGDVPFAQLFPGYAPPGQGSPESYPKTGWQQEVIQEIAGDDTLDLTNTRIIPGMYVLELDCTHENGEKVEQTYYFSMYDDLSPELPAHLAFVPPRVTGSAKVAQTASYRFISSQPMHILTYIEKPRASHVSQWRTADPEILFDTLIRKEDRGGFDIHTIFVFQNRVYTFRDRVDVPWSDKELDIRYITYRDKTLPGAEEEWRIVIRDEDALPVAAEFLATMYDASLDAFVPHQWLWSIYPFHRSTITTRAAGFRASRLNFVVHQWGLRYTEVPHRQYRDLLPVLLYLSRLRNYVREDKSLYRSHVLAMPEMQENMADPVMLENNVANMDMAGEPVEPAMPEPEPPDIGTGGEVTIPPRQLRKDLNETVFFYPRLMTDKEGHVVVRFRMGEALTRWNFLGLAHTKDLQYAFTRKTLITQKDLMVFPNPPRFFRQGDEIYFSGKVSNVSDRLLEGKVRLQILDGITDRELNTAFDVADAEQSFSVKAGASTGFVWRLAVPEDRTMPVRYRMIAEAGDLADGEEAIVPVLSNRMLVTESLPLPVSGNSRKSFSFPALQTRASTTAKPHRFTLEFTSNPVWYAVQALPYLREYPYACSEQIFSRLYANLLSRHILDELPQIKAVFDAWSADPGQEALLSPLSKNQELKSALLEETPWVLDALDEEEQRKQIALLFDLNTISNQTERSLLQLQQMQLSNGGFPWFAGGRDNWYITQYLVEGFGHLEKLGAFSYRDRDPASAMLVNAVRYIDQRIIQHYNRLKDRVEAGQAKWEEDHLDAMVVHYLYARSFHKEFELSNGLQEIMAYYLKQAKRYWPGRPLYHQACMVLALHRWQSGDPVISSMIQSFSERAIQHPELGMYWKAEAGWNWYQLPVERHALLIEVFDEVARDQASIDKMRIWLLKNKQTNRWETTKATAAAIYALLMQEDSWLTGEMVSIRLGDLELETATAEAGSGYLKKQWAGNAIDRTFGSIDVRNPNDHIAWGAAYYQYFEDLDEITQFEETPLQVRKALFRIDRTDAGEQLVAIADGAALVPGDRLMVRIEIRVDRPMAFVHLKDMRASGLEPLDVLSRYRWQGGLGYYQSTGDLATHFFMDDLPRGTWVFEYPLRVVHQGRFSNGIATIQCMYAPEFSAHSEGIRLDIQGPQQ